MCSSATAVCRIRVPRRDLSRAERLFPSKAAIAGPTAAIASRTEISVKDARYATLQPSASAISARVPSVKFRSPLRRWVTNPRVRPIRRANSARVTSASPIIRVIASLTLSTSSLSRRAGSGPGLPSTHDARAIVLSEQRRQRRQRRHGGRSTSRHRRARLVPGDRTVGLVPTVCFTPCLSRSRMAGVFTACDPGRASPPARAAVRDNKNGGVDGDSNPRPPT